MTDNPLTKKLNILFINRWVGYNQGGNETHIKDLMEQFSKKGHKVTVITTGGSALDYLKTKIKVEFVKGPQVYFSNELFGLVHALIFILKCFGKFIQLYFAGEKYDVISVHFSLEAFLARFLKLVFGIPYVLVLAGDTPLELIEGRRADGKVSISNFMNEQCKKFGYSAEVLPKGIDLSRFSPGVNFSDLFKKENLSGKVAILTVARLEPRKNLITLVEAANVIVNEWRMKNFVFYIIGDGVERRFLEKNIEKYRLGQYVKLLGALSNSDPLFAKYYAMCQLFVLPTLYEGFGWVFLEAMACGLSIITTKVGSNFEIVGDVGVLVEPKRPDLLARKILETLNDKQTLEKMKKLGLEKAKSYSWENLMPKYENYYSSVSEKKCSGLGCKVGVIGEIIVDFFEILQRLIKDKVVSKHEKKAWSGSGQEGMQN